MLALRNFEVKAIQLLAGSTLDQLQLNSVAAFTGSPEYKYTGSGYYLTLRMPTLPALQATLSRPPVMGTADDIECGFIVFLEHGELTLECYTWGAIDVPCDFRDRNVTLSLPDAY